METSLEQFARLFNMPTQSILKLYPINDSVVKKVLTKNQKLVSKKITNTSILEKQSFKQLEEIENSLKSVVSEGDMSQPNDLAQIIDSLRVMIPEKDVEGMYMKENVARSILKRIPPTNLLHFFGFTTTNELYTKMSPLTAIAITRNTEHTPWQEQYFKILSTLTVNDFEKRKVSCVIVDNNFFLHLFKLVGKPLKPWNISHNKEAGIVTCFTKHRERNEIFTFPTTQIALTFFHYFFETKCAGDYIESLTKNNHICLGGKVKDMIITNKKNIPGFHPNIYAEQLFWRKAIHILKTISPLNLHVQTQSCVQNLNNTTLYSINIIDHVWNHNLNKIRDIYFSHITTDLFIYHGQEALWSEVLNAHLTLSKSDFDREIIANLNLNDIEFTYKMISGYGKPQNLS